MNKRDLKKVQATAMQCFPFVLLIGVVIGGFYAGIALDWWENPFVITPTPTPPEVESDKAEFLVLDYASGAELDKDDYEIYVYEVDTEDMTDSEIDDLVYTDYSLEGSYDSGEDLEATEFYQYWAKLNGSDVVEYWFIPVFGQVNTIYAMNATEDVAIMAYSTDELSTTFNQTNYDEWTIWLKTLDGAEGTGELTDGEGYKAYYDFEDDDWAYVCLEITFNTTAQLSWCDFDSTGYEVNEKVASSVLYYEIECVLIGEIEFLIDLGSGLGTDFEVTQIAVSYGDAESNTDWDSQT